MEIFDEWSTNLMQGLMRKMSVLFLWLCSRLQAIRFYAQLIGQTATTPGISSMILPIHVVSPL
jgi:hypothetical protein